MKIFFNFFFFFFTFSSLTYKERKKKSDIYFFLCNNNTFLNSVGSEQTLLLQVISYLSHLFSLRESLQLSSIQNITSFNRNNREE